MTLFKASLVITLVMFASMTMAWLYQKKVSKADIVDFVWTCGVGISGLYMLSIGNGDATRRLVIGCLLSIWSVRLASYLYFTRVIKEGEDGRYRVLRDKWGLKANLNFFILFQVQAIFVLIFSFVFYGVSQNLKSFPNFFDIVALLIFSVSIIGESISDQQLKEFRTDINNKNKVCRVGMWRYSRHPNYFFEWLHWCSYPLFAIGSTTFVFTLHGPLFLLFLIYKVTGIPPTEKQILITRGAAYRQYQETTSPFFPWFPKNKAEK